MLSRCVTAEIDMRVPADPSKFRDVCQSWFEDAFASVCADHLENLKGGAPLVASGTWPLKGGYADGPPGSTWALLSITHVTKRGDRRVTSKVWSERNLSWFYDQLEKAPLKAQISITTLNSAGLPGDRGAEIVIERPYEVPDWLVLSVKEYLGMNPSSGMVEVTADQMYALILRQAPHMDPAFGYVTDDADSILGLTPLEEALYIDLEETLPRTHETLRGYSWVTVASKGVTDRLGGTAGLRDRGGFYDCRELPNGATVLRATERLSGYEAESLMKTFKTLAPALPCGAPPEKYTQKYRLVADNADDYRR